MKILTTNVSLDGPHGPTTLHAGDPLPDWATDRVGDHALADGQVQELVPVEEESVPVQVAPAPVEAEPVDEPDEAEEPADESGAPDFTGPATPRPRSRRRS